jgi:ComF family protein
MMRADPPRCEVCWKPEIDDWCQAPDALRPAFKGVRAAFSYSGPARAAVLALKFHGLAAIAKTMAVPMAERLVEWDPNVSAIVPVPLAPSRKRSRGYNQSELLAREIGRLTNLPVVAGALVRSRATPPQVRQFDWEARRDNVAGAFAAGARRVHGGVLLVDDVVTTSATLDACARVLLSAGGGPVFALTFARED